MHKCQVSNIHLENNWLYYLGSVGYGVFFNIIIINMFRVLGLITYLNEISAIGVGY